MREYETIFITQPNLSEAQHGRIADRLRSVIDKHHGRIFFTRDLGKRQLAYMIGKETHGTYTLADYAAGSGCVREIERNFRLDENVLRFLTVMKQDPVDVEKRAAEVVARGEDAPAAGRPAEKKAELAAEKKADTAEEPKAETKADERSADSEKEGN